MASRFVWCVVFCFCSGLLSAQNLVVNPGFEVLKEEQEGGLCHYFNSPRRIKQVSPGWYDFSWATPDVIVYDSTNIHCAKARPHTGDSMAGLYLYVPKEDVGRDESYREFLIGSLHEPLVKGQVYEFSIWIQRNAALGGLYLQQAIGGPVSLAGFSASHLGVIFTTALPGEHTRFLEDSRQFGEKPRVLFEEVIATVEGEWIRLSTQFKVWQACQYFVIGAFAYDQRIVLDPQDVFDRIGEDNQLRKQRLKPRTRRYAYYAIDDVYIGPPRPDIAKMLEEGQRFRFEQLLFQSASAELEPGTEQELTALVQVLQKHPEWHIQVVGHTDNVGSAATNQQLSTARARTVYDFLVHKGITTERLSYRGFGESRPIDTNDTEAGRHQNRRVEIVREGG